MTSLPERRTHRKVFMATPQDIHRLDLLRTLVEQDPLFASHGVHDAELLRASVAFTVHALTGDRPQIRAFLLSHIAQERQASEQVHAHKMQEAWQKQQARRGARPKAPAGS